MAGQTNSGGQAPQGAVSDSVIIFGGIIAAVVIAWLSVHEGIAAVVMKLRALESYLVPFDPRAQAVVRQWIATVHPKNVTLEQILQSGEVLGQMLCWGVAGILGALAVFLIYRSPEFPGRYTQTYTMASLARQESTLWPTILPVLDQNLIDVPIDDPVQGMRQRPRDYGYRLKFIVQSALLKDFPADGESINPREVLLVGRARAVFTKQLGRPWQGIDALQPHERALFAAFAAQANYENDKALALIDDLPSRYQKAIKAKNAALITSSLVAPLINAYSESDAVKRVLSRHTYVRTVLMAMLMAARKNGIFPPSWFRWLKTVDRITWYALNDLGTENASVEAAGVRCHWNAERLTRAPMDEPEVEAAIDGLRDYLQEILDEDPEVD